jgi:hypothetical protein
MRRMQAQQMPWHKHKPRRPEKQHHGQRLRDLAIQATPDYPNKMHLRSDISIFLLGADRRGVGTGA